MGFFSITAAIFTAAADLKIKEVMREISPETVIYNSGFAANRLDHRPRAVACASAALTAALAAFFLFSENGTVKARPCEKAANALILGGAISNTYERIVRGKVTDYIPLGRYVYNLADFAIYSGALIKLLNAKINL